MKGTRIRPATFVLSVLVLTGLFLSCAGMPAAPRTPTLNDLVIKGDLDGIRKFYSNQEQLNMQDAQGLFPLHYAVSRAGSQIAEILIVLGARVDVQDRAGKTPLRYAIDRRYADTARMLVEKGANPFVADAAGTTSAEAALGAGGDMVAAVFTPKTINSSGLDGRTALHIAADRLMKDVVFKLLDMGAQAQIPDKAGRTPLDLALLYPDRVEAAYIAERLILRGANQTFPEYSWFVKSVRAMDYNSIRFDDDNTPLHEAVNLRQKGFVIFLLDRKVALNIRNRKGEAPLHRALALGWLEGAGLILSAQADPNIRDADNRTPLHIPMPEQIRLAGTRLLIKHNADPSLKDNAGNTPLHIAVNAGYPVDILSTLVSAGAPVNAANAAGDTPLIISVRSGNLVFAAPLISNGADLFMLNLAKESALSLAIGAGSKAVDAIVTRSNVTQRDNLGNSILSTAVGLKGSGEIISLILSRGADPNTRNNSGDSALHIAVRENLEDQGRILLNAKADIFGTNTKGESPLVLGLEHAKGPLGWLFTPTTLAARDANGDSPLHIASKRNLGPGILYLVEREPTLMDATNGSGETPLHAAVRVDGVEASRVLLSLGARTSARDAIGDTPLATSVLWNSNESMKVLVLSGADTDARNFAGETPLHQAVRRKNSVALAYLLDHGSSLDPRDSRGQTPLAVAAANSATDQARALITAGSDIEARDLSGKTPLAFAVETGNLELLRLLVGKDADILATNLADESPLTMSFRKGTTLLRELLSPASINRADSEGRTPLRILVDKGMSVEHIEVALAAGADPGRRNRKSETPLLEALRRKDYGVATRLVAAGSDIFAVDSEGRSPASYAIEQGRSAIQALVAVPDGIKMRDGFGNGLLHYAANAGNTESAKTVLSLGADPSLRNIRGETAMALALKRDNKALADILDFRTK